MKKYSLLICILFTFCFSGRPESIPAPKTKWSFQTQGTIRSAPVADQENLYFGSSDGYLYAVRKTDGDLVWKFQTAGAITGSPALGDRNVFVSSRDNFVYAIDIRTGTLKWKFQMQALLPFDWHWEYYTAAPVVTRTHVFIGSGDGNLYALSADQGKVIWKFKTNGRIRATPLVVNETIYQPCLDGVVYAVSAKTGSLLWKFETDGATIDSKKFGWDRNSIYSRPGLQDSVLVVASRDGMAYAINIQTHKEKWRFTYGPSWGMSAAVDNGVAFIGWSDNSLFSAIDLNTGKEKWKFKAGSFVYSTPVILGEEVFFGSGDHKVYCLNKSSGEKKWEYALGGPILSSPLIDGQTLFIGSDDGRMVAISDRMDAMKAVYSPVPRNHMFETIFTADKAITPYLEDRGFQRLDSVKLISFLTNRIKDKMPSVVVFAYRLVPDNIIGDDYGQGLLRTYLEAGGKIIWFGDVPIVLRFDEKGQIAGMNTKPAVKMLGINYVRPTENGNYYSKATQTGLNWGLPLWFTSTFANVNPEGIIPLAFDEYNRVSVWLKKFDNKPGSGFLSFRTWSYNVPILESDLQLIYKLATHELE